MDNGESQSLEIFLVSLLKLDFYLLRDDSGFQYIKISFTGKLYI